MLLSLHCVYVQVCGVMRCIYPTFFIHSNVQISHMGISKVPIVNVHVGMFLYFGQGPIQEFCVHDFSSWIVVKV